MMRVVMMLSVGKPYGKVYWQWVLEVDVGIVEAQAVGMG
jgi:hypothetical protein